MGCSVGQQNHNTGPCEPNHEPQSHTPASTTVSKECDVLHEQSNPTPEQDTNSLPSSVAAEPSEVPTESHKDEIEQAKDVKNEAEQQRNSDNSTHQPNKRKHRRMISVARRGSCSPTYRDEHGWTALHWSCFLCNKTALNLLVGQMMGLMDSPIITSDGEENAGYHFFELNEDDELDEDVEMDPEKDADKLFAELGCRADSAMILAIKSLGSLTKDIFGEEHQQPVDPNFWHVTGITPLMLAIQQENIDIVSTLLQYGASLEPCTANKDEGRNAAGWNVVHWAAYTARQSIVSAISEQEADFSLLTDANESCICLCIKGCGEREEKMELRRKAVARERDDYLGEFYTFDLMDEEEKQVLLEKDSNRTIERRKDFECYCEWRDSMREEACNVVLLLIEQKSGFTDYDKNGFTPLHWACHFGLESLVKLLLSHGADPNVPTTGFVSPNVQGSSPLSMAVRSHWEAERTMVRANLYREGQEKFKLGFIEKEQTVSKEEVHNANLPTLETPYDLKDLDKIGCGLNESGYAELVTERLQIASNRIVVLLIDKNANVNSFDIHGWSPAHWACFYPSLETISFLVDNGAELGTATLTDMDEMSHHSDGYDGSLFKHECRHIGRTYEAGNTCLSLAVQKRSEKIVRFLVGKRVDPNSLSSREFTPLHWAVGFKLPQIFQILLANGADSSVVDVNGYSLLHRALHCGSLYMFELLLYLGIGVYSPSNLLLADASTNSQVLSCLPQDKQKQAIRLYRIYCMRILLLPGKPQSPLQDFLTRVKEQDGLKQIFLRISDFLLFPTLDSM